MKQIFWFYIGIVFCLSCQGQVDKTYDQKLLGGPCEGCEAIHEFAGLKMKAFDTLPGFDEASSKLKLQGVVFERDGKTPAANVILYIYHTDSMGIYKSEKNAVGWARRHGMYRGWAKTDQMGQYAFYTFQPASYPNSTEPQHIHLTVKEPNKKEYYLDEFVFDDDPLLTSSKRSKLSNRGGSGIVKTFTEDGIHVATREIILGKNIPHYY